jgi:hypothetical protein
MTTYNGWPNHETWVASLYCESLEDVCSLREYLEEIAADLPLPAMDLLLSAVASVNWEYLERAFSPTDTDTD